MKKLSFFAVCALAVASCTNGSKQAQLAAEMQRDSLNQIIAQKENEITDMMTTLSDIEEADTSSFHYFFPNIFAKNDFFSFNISGCDCKFNKSSCIS